MTRKKYTEEFKREAVRLMLNRGERTVGEIGEQLGVDGNMLHRWRKKFGPELGFTEATGDNGTPSPERKEIESLRRQLRETQRERDFLKKAAAFFAKETS